ncbi:Uncharacterized protein QTN25_002589 [Entamoeba marina]
MIALLLLISFAFADESFLGPQPLKEHTFEVKEVYNNSFISYNYALIVFCLPLALLVLSVLFFGNLKGLASKNGMKSLIFVGCATGFICFVGYSWMYCSFFEMLWYGAVIIPVVLLSSYIATN